MLVLRLLFFAATIFAGAARGMRSARGTFAAEVLHESTSVVRVRLTHAATDFPVRAPKNPQRMLSYGFQVLCLCNQNETPGYA